MLIGVPVAVSIPVLISVSERMPAMVASLLVALLVQIVTPVVIAVAITAAEIAMRIVVPGRAMRTPMTAAMAPVPIVVEPVHCVDQRVGDRRADQQVDCRVAIVAGAGAQRNRQAQRKPRRGKPFRAVSERNVSGNNILSGCIHRLVLFQQDATSECVVAPEPRMNRNCLNPERRTARTKL